VSLLASSPTASVPARWGFFISTQPYFVLLAFVLLHFFLELPWSVEPVRLSLGILGATLLTILTGFLATYRIIGRKPLAVLRQE